MEIFEYMEVQVNADERYYIRRVVNRQKPRPFHEPPDILYYPGAHLDLGKYYVAQGWEIIRQYPNHAYLFRRRQSHQPPAPDD